MDAGPPLSLRRCDMKKPNEWNGEPGWPRPRKVPMTNRGEWMAASCFVQSDPSNPLSAHPERLQDAFTNFLCQVCGMPVPEVDSVGWVLLPKANMGGACCTRCMYLAVRKCPHLEHVPADAYQLWAVTEARQYTWLVENGVTAGKIVPIENSPAQRHTWSKFMAHYKGWKAAQSCVVPHHLLG